MQAWAVLKSNESQFVLSTGSRFLAFPTTGGRSYTGTIAVVDEADFVPDLRGFLNAVKPTIDAGGQLFLITTSDKTRPLSTFKRLYRAALRQAQHKHFDRALRLKPGTGRSEQAQRKQCRAWATM